MFAGRLYLLAGALGVGAARLIVLLGVVSLLADVVYESGRSVSGPLLSSLGAPAIVAGSLAVGELVSHLVKPVGGYLASALGWPRGAWVITFSGYSMTAASIPMLSLAGSWPEAFALYLVDRVGKGLRSPARDSIIASAARGMGYGRAFAIHEVLDQVGALAGPLAFSAAIAGLGQPRAFAVLAVPGASSLATLALAYKLASRLGLEARAKAREGGRPLLGYLAFASLTSMAFAQWALVSYKYAAVAGPEVIAVSYALAMGVDAVSAYASGVMLDRLGIKTLALAPVAAGLSTALLAAPPSHALLLGHSALWGAAMGVYESAMRAGVAVISGPSPRAYGAYGLASGLGLAAGGLLIPLIYSRPAALLLYTMACAGLAIHALRAARRSR